MKTDVLAKTCAILFCRAHVLPHLLCLLLVFSLPVLAQVPCDYEHIETAAIDAHCVLFESANPSGCDEGFGDTVGFDPDATGCTSDPLAAYYDGELFLKKFYQGATKLSDQRNTYDMGIDPATLNPEALDLNIFPSFEISAQLSLIPSLSYSPDQVMGRLGRLNYGPPKQWRNHYGELVVMVSSTASQKVPIGDPIDESQANDTDRKPVVSELQVFYINASGQQVNFNPDPSGMNNNNAPSAANGQVGSWYSEDGGYRLVDLAASGASPTGPFEFELTTSAGLILSFQAYTYQIDRAQETLVRRYRVDRITDRYNNYVAVIYRDEGEPGYPVALGATLQPYQVKGFNNDDTMLQALTYVYDTQHRLAELVMPGFAGATQSYKFFYLDSDQIIHLPLADGTTTNRLKLNNLYSSTLVSANSGQNVILKPLITVPGHVGSRGTGSRGLFLNFEDLGFMPEIGIDLLEVFPAGSTFAGQFRSAPYQFHLVEHENLGLFNTDGKSRQVFTPLAFEQDALAYRYQSDPSHYPNTSVAANYPDYVKLLFDASQTGIADGEVSVSVMPRLKQGDLLTWIDSANQVQAAELQVTDVTPSHVSNGQYSYPLTLVNGANPSGQSLHFIRKDQRDRIAEIEYPGLNGSSRKRMLFKYAEHSRNHAEIEQVLLFDEPLPSGQVRLLSQTDYTYEHVLIQTAAEDLAPLLLEPIPEYLWSNCVRTGRELAAVGNVAGVDVGIDWLRRHEVIDMLRHKRQRYYEPGLQVGPENNCVYPEYRDLETFYGGAWRFALMSRSVGNEASALPDVLRTCDEIEWGIAQKPFSFTWQINPDGSGQVFDLSADGVGLDPVLAYANRGVRVFKTYQFDTQFKQALAASNYGHFLGIAPDKYAAYFQYLPSYVVSGGCTGCTIPDLEASPTLPSNRIIPTMAQIFAMSATKAYAATLQLFEPLPLYGYDLLTDIGVGDPLRKVALGTLHGSIHGTLANSDRFYYRVSAVFGIDRMINNDPNCDAPLIDQYFRGQFTSDVKTKLNPGGTQFQYEIPWVYGGDLSSGSCFNYLQQRQKNHRLRPHAQIQLRKLAGLKWDATKNLIDLEADATDKVSPWVVEASRFSNGGYLGEGSAGGSTTLANQNQLLNASLPTGVQPGDYFYYNKMMYQLGQDLGGGAWAIEPSLGDSATALSALQFYRYYDPNAAATFPYLGYDVFGNNGFKATYKRKQLFFSHAQNKANGQDHGLVPDFFHSQSLPFSLALNDSTAPSNNDDTDWRYFGRVGRQFVTGSLPLNAENANGTVTPLTSWQTGMLTEWLYNYTSSAYDWQPTDKVAYFLPPSLSGNLHQLNLASLAGLTANTHGEDGRTAYRYYSPGGISSTFYNPIPMSHGRVGLTWTGKGSGYPADTQISATRYAYDSDGWLSIRDTATFLMNGATGNADYGTRTSFTSDPAMGLVTSEATRVFHDPSWNSGGSTAEGRLIFNGTGVLRGRTQAEYDGLGRKTQVKTYHAGNDLFGNIIGSEYPSQTQSVTKTQDTNGALLSTQMRFSNGQGQVRAALRQRAGTADADRAYGVFTEYDALGRVARTSAERELSDVTNLVDEADGLAEAEGYTQTLYNLRGEAFGTVIYQGTTASQGTWVLAQQDDTTGDASSLQIQQVPDNTVAANATLAKLNIKRMSLDANGLLTQVTDYQKALAMGLWTQQTETGLATVVGDLASETPLAKAQYSYDRMQQVIQADVGITSLQTRTFIYDQRNRLRAETHPEMPNITVSYDDFDHYDNAQTIEHKLASTVLRRWTSAYDTAGNLLQLEAGNPATTLTTTYLYNYNAFFNPGSPEPQAYPELPRFIRHSDNQGGIYAYWHAYDGDKGLLGERRLYHNHAGFPGESSDLATVNLTTVVAPSASQIIAAKYQYDALGRMATLTYPAATTGMQNPTHLDYLYGEHGLLTGVDDIAFPQKLALLDDLDYGVGDQLINVDFASPSLANKNRLQRTYDDLNRMKRWKVVWSGGTAQFSQDRDYAYDQAGRIRQIALDGVTNGDGFQYAYDGLGQMGQAEFVDPSAVQTTTWTYEYNDGGFGNLTSFSENGVPQIGTLDVVDLTNNQLDTAADYSPLGEMTQFTQDTTPYTMTYNDLGRMATLTTTDMSSVYHYDHAGMRLFTRIEGSQTGLDQAQTLYFYDANGMVLCEWTSQKQPDSTWTSPRWDRSYIYLAGQSSLTYEYDGVATSAGPPPPMPSGPSITSSAQLTQPLIQWQDVGPGGYDLEIEEDQGQRRSSFTAIDGNQFQHPALKYGKYRVRARRSDQAWGAWQTFYFMDVASQDHVGIYALDWQPEDRSYYRNSATPAGAVHYIDGKNETGLFLNQGERLDILAPHAQLTGSQASVSFWAKPIVDASSETLGTDRELWSLGEMRLTINKHGQLKLSWKGTAGLLPNVSLTGQTWQHLVLIYGNNSMQLYVDNLLAFNLTNGPNSNELISAPMRWGHPSTNLGAESGIDEARCFNRALSSADIQTEFTRWN